MNIHETFRGLQIATLTLAASHKQVSDLVETLERDTVGVDSLILYLDLCNVSSAVAEQLDKVKQIQLDLGRNLGIIPEGTGE